MVNKNIHKILLWLLFLSTIGAYAVMALKFPIAYIWATYEDLYGEWTQFYLFLAALLFSISNAMRFSRYRRFFILLALACFYTVMEEISWGQRVFQVTSPELFKSHNLQGEMNFHNFLVGPYHTQLKVVIEYLLAAALTGYGFIYPLLIHLRFRPVIWLERHGLASPPLYLAPLFLLTSYLELEPFSFNEAEVAELLVGIAMAIMALHYAFALKKNLDIHNSLNWGHGDSFRLALCMVVTIILVVLASTVTTQLLYASPERRVQIDNRIENGIKKFAGRYTRYKLWDKAVMLYTEYYKLKPNSTSRLRSLAKAHRRAGNLKLHELYLDKALQIALKRYKKNPNSSSNNRSLALIYRMLGNKEKEQLHIKKALKLGLVRIERKPDSAAAAFSLGKTYKIMGNQIKALEFFKRAYELEPTRSRYRKAYLRQKTMLHQRKDN